MRRTSLSIPEIALIAGTRGMLGAGVGLLVADRLSSEQRRAVGWTLFAIGALTTIPIGVQLFQSLREDDGSNGRVRAFADPQSVTP